MAITNIKCVIFDCDGTLVDSERLLHLDLLQLLLGKRARDIFLHYTSLVPHATSTPPYTPQISPMSLFVF